MRYRIEGQVAGRILLGLLLTIGSNMAGTAWAQKPADSKAQNAQVFSGVVQEVDAKAGKILIKTEVGKSVDLEVLKPELLKDIEKEDRITVTVDEKQRATKIMKSIPIPEVPATVSPPGSEKPGVSPGSQ